MLNVVVVLKMATESRCYTRVFHPGKCCSRASYIQADMDPFLGRAYKSDM